MAGVTDISHGARIRDLTDIIRLPDYESLVNYYKYLTESRESFRATGNPLFKAIVRREHHSQQIDGVCVGPFLEIPLRKLLSLPTGSQEEFTAIRQSIKQRCVEGLPSLMKYAIMYSHLAISPEFIRQVTAQHEREDISFKENFVDYMKLNILPSVEIGQVYDFYRYIISAESLATDTKMYVSSIIDDSPRGFQIPGPSIMIYIDSFVKNLRSPFVAYYDERLNPTVFLDRSSINEATGAFIQDKMLKNKIRSKPGILVFAHPKKGTKVLPLVVVYPTENKLLIHHQAFEQGQEMPAEEIDSILTDVFPNIPRAAIENVELHENRGRFYITMGYGDRPEGDTEYDHSRLFDQGIFNAIIAHNPKLNSLIYFNETKKVRAEREYLSTFVYVLKPEGVESPIVWFTLVPCYIDKGKLRGNDLSGKEGYLPSHNCVMINYKDFDDKVPNIITIDGFRYLMLAVCRAYRELANGYEMFKEPPLDRPIVMSDKGVYGLAHATPKYRWAEQFPHTEIGRKQALDKLQLLFKQSNIEFVENDDYILDVPLGSKDAPPGYYITKDLKWRYPWYRSFSANGTEGGWIITYRFPKGRIVEKQSDKFYIIKTQKILGPLRRGVVPQRFADYLGLTTAGHGSTIPESNFLRLGVARRGDPQSFFECMKVIKRMDNQILKQTMIDKLYLIKQEFPEVTPDDIERLFEGEGEQKTRFDGEIYYHFFERAYFDEPCNIFFFKITGKTDVEFILPRFKSYHTRSIRPDLPCLIIFDNRGPGTGHTFVPHYEIACIERVNEDRSLDHEFFFPAEITRKLYSLFFRVYGAPGNPTHHILHVASTHYDLQVLMGIITKQYIDEFGKVRIVQKKQGDNLVLVGCPPVQPLNVPLLTIEELTNGPQFTFTPELPNLAAVDIEDGNYVGMWLMTEFTASSPEDGFKEYLEGEFPGMPLAWREFFPTNPVPQTSFIKEGLSVKESIQFRKFRHPPEVDMEREMHLRRYIDFLYRICLWLYQLSKLPSNKKQLEIRLSVPGEGASPDFYDFSALWDYLPSFDRLETALEWLKEKNTGLIDAKGSLVFPDKELVDGVVMLFRRYDRYATLEQRIPITVLPFNYSLDKITRPPSLKYTGLRAEEVIARLAEIDE